MPRRKTPPHPATLRSGRWQVRLLGGFDARDGQATMRHAGRTPVRLLMARLALEPGRLHDRAELARWLFPELSEPAQEAHCKRRFSKELNRLGADLEPAGTGKGSVLVADRRSVQLNPDAVESDTGRVLAALARGDPQAALAGWTGELLPELDDAWTALQRQRFAALLAQARADVAAGPALAPQHDAAPAVFAFAHEMIGRESDIARLQQALAEHRVVLLFGGAGFGKTRVAGQAADAAGGFRVKRSVRLDRLADPRQVAEAMAITLGLERGAEPATEADPPAQALRRLRHRLGNLACLFVLDGAEHLPDDSLAGAVQQLLDALPGLRLLLTSRRRLPGLQAHEIELRPLPLPAASAMPLPEAARRSAAVRLYEQRAKLARDDFQLHAGNTAAVVALCRILGGVPLAIELAAARVREFPPARLLATWQRDPRAHELLERPGTRAQREGRHGSLAALLAWSWSRLERGARDALAALAAFPDGAEAAAWAEVAGAAEIAGQAGLLVDGSLVQRTEGPPAVYRLQPLLRGFVLAEQAASMPALARRHRQQVLGRLKQLRPWRMTERDDADAEAALLHAVEARDDGVALQIASALADRWLAHGTSSAALEALRTVAERAAPGAATELLALLPRLLMHAGFYEEARVRAEAALAEAQAVARRRAPALSTDTLLRWAMAPFPNTAAALLASAREASALAQRARLARLWPATLLLLGALEQELDAIDTAQSLFERARSLYRRRGDELGEVRALPGLTACLMRRKQFAEAAVLAAEGEIQAARLGDRVTQMRLCERQSVSLEALDRFDEALQVCRRQARTSHRHGLGYALMYALWNQCEPLLRTGDPDTATLLLAWTSQRWDQDIVALSPDDWRGIGTLRSQARVLLGQRREARLWARGLALDTPTAAALGGA